MLEKLDIILKPVMFQLLDGNYSVVNNQLRDSPSGDEAIPAELQDIISEAFNIDMQGARLIVYEWLYFKGYKDIEANWFGPIIWNDPSQLDFNLDITGTTDLSTIYGDNMTTISSTGGEYTIFSAETNSWCH